MDDLIIEMEEGFKVGTEFFKKSDGWTRALMQDMTTQIKAAYDAGYREGLENADD